MTKRRTQIGFTLIELMIVVAVVGILAAIAYPAYTDAVIKGKRAQARTALLEVMQQQERYMTQSNTYLDFATTNAGVVTSAAYTATPFPLKYFSGDNATNPAYWLSANKCDAATQLTECVAITATPNFTDAAVGTLTLTSTGQKSCGTTITIPANARLCWP